MRINKSRIVILLVMGAALVVALSLSACGGGSDSTSSASTEPSESTESTGEGTESSGEGGAEELTGSPIKTFTVTTIQAQAVPLYPAAGEAAKAFGQYVNSHGGLNGHPLEVTVCDDRGESSQATGCAREAVEAGAVAGVGSYSAFGSDIVSVLEKADTAWFGIPSVQSSPELESPVSFPTGSIPANGAALVAKAYEEGCKNVNAIILEGAEKVFEPVMKNAAKASGKSIGKFVVLPAEAKDYSPQVAEVLGGDADCVLGVIAETQYQGFMPAWQQAGTDARLYGVQGNLNENAIEGYEEIAEGAVIGGPFPDLSTKPWTKMREALKEYGANEEFDYDSITALGAWNGYTAFADVVDHMKGPINHTTFLEAASKTTDLETEGQIPTLDFTKEWTNGLEGFPRLFNRSVAFSKIEGGKVVADTEDLYDASELMLGTGPLGPGVSP